MRPSSLLLPLILLTALPAGAAAQQEASAPAKADVRIYRCVDSRGGVALQDSPCTSGRQEIRDMQRPQARVQRQASSASVPVANPAPAVAQREVRSVRVQPPQPMYECTNAETGERYVSDDGQGNPRWVAAWTEVWLPAYGQGRPDHPHRPPHRPPPRPRPPGDGSGMPPVRPASGVSIRGGVHMESGEYSRQSHVSGQGHVISGTVVPIGSTLVRDACHALPQREVCGRLSDQRWDLVRRYNSALQGERDRINREQRAVDARIEQDCQGN